MRNYQYVPQFQVRSDIRSGEGGGYVDGVWYPDQSGVCDGSTTQPPAPAPVPPPPPRPRAAVMLAVYGIRIKVVCVDNGKVSGPAHCRSGINARRSI